MERSLLQENFMDVPMWLFVVPARPRQKRIPLLKSGD
jgi:hypothetical protein